MENKKVENKCNVDFHIIPYEYECGSYCTPTGCHGHKDYNILIGFELNSELFYIEGADCGDYPNLDKPEQIEKVNNIIKTIENKLST
jgi:hypothetical protein